MDEALRDIKGPLSLHGHINFYFWAAILLLVVGAALVFLYLSRRKSAAAVVRKLLAHEIAYKQLEALRQSDLIRQGRIKEYYSQISDIIRHYLENRFLLKAPEMTTEEFLSYVRDKAEFVREHKALLKDFLVACDLVKFAKHAPSAADMEAIFESAKKLVDETCDVGAGLKPAPTVA
ncbi:MAG: hypothetical protein Q8O22_08345 [Candidatus Omnitrophota bacterium]|nr:hypothetical protein [Candidatus Omnitrophota bacterium]